MASRSVTWSSQLSFDGSFESSFSNTTHRQSGGKPPMPSRSSLKKTPMKPPSMKGLDTSSLASQSLSMQTQSTEQSHSTSQTSTSGRALEAVLSATKQSMYRRDGDESWRKHGKVYRAKLVMDDEESGGNTFVLSDNCGIERYYDVAEKVLEQFLKTNIADKSDLTECFLVGNRLVKFLSTVLPTHKNYFTQEPQLVELRNNSQAQLVQLMQYLEQLAIIIDEEELNKHILQDLKSTTSESTKESTLGSTTASSIVSSPSKSLPSVPESTSPISTGSKHTLELDTSMDYSNQSLRHYDSHLEASDDVSRGESHLIHSFLAYHDSQLNNVQHSELDSWDNAFGHHAGQQQSFDLQQESKAITPTKEYEPPDSVFAEKKFNDFELHFPGVSSADTFPMKTQSSRDWVTEFENVKDLDVTPTNVQGEGRQYHQTPPTQPNTPSPPAKNQIGKHKKEEIPFQDNYGASRLNTASTFARINSDFYAPGVDSFHSTTDGAPSLPSIQKLEAALETVKPRALPDLVEWTLPPVPGSRIIPSDETSLQADEETHSTYLDRRWPMKHFKGCIKCLLE